MDNALLGLFLSAFISSSLLPGGSELLLLYLYDQDPSRFGLLLLVATLGNTLGAMTSWGLGRFLVWRFPLRTMDKPKHRRALAWLQDYGAIALLLSWLPVIGDPLCLIAGWLRIEWWRSLIFIAVGKGLRYYVLLLLV